MPGNAAAEGGFGRDAPSRSDDNDRGGASKDKESKAESFDRAMDNANRPDRTPATPSKTTTVADDNGDDKSDDRQDRAAGPPGIGAPPSSASPADADKGEPEATRQSDAADIVGVAGYAAAGGYAGIDGARRGVDYSARAAAARTLTNGNAGNLPVQGSEYANRADLAKGIRDTRITVDDALGKTPYGPNAQSTQQLNAATKPVSTLGAAAKTVGWGLQPAAGALQGYRTTPDDAGVVQTTLNTARAAVKELDDTAVSYGAGTLAAGGVVLGSPLAGPAAPAVAIGGAPAAGMAAGIGMGQLYNDSLPDKVIDKGADAVFDSVESVVDTVSDAFNYVGSQIDQWETHITEQVVRQVTRRAND